MLCSLFDVSALWFSWVDLLLPIVPLSNFNRYFAIGSYPFNITNKLFTEPYFPPASVHEHASKIHKCKCMPKRPSTHLLLQRPACAIKVSNNYGVIEKVHPCYSCAETLELSL